MKEAHERVKAVMEHFNLNKNSFSKAIGYNQNTTIGRLVNEGRKPSQKTLDMIVARFPEISMEWLLTGRGEMLTEPKLNAKERFEKLRNFTGKSSYEIAKDIDVSYAFFNAIETERNTEITKDIGERIVKAYPGISLEWILTGKGEMLNKKSDAQLIPTNYMKVPKVPVHAQAGFLVGYGDAEYMEELPTEIWEVDTEYKGKYICFEVKGDSMDNGTIEAIIEGDRLLCREIQHHHWQNKLHIKKWQKFVIAHKSEGILIKQITSHDTKKGIITCHSLNNFYDDIEINLNDVVALYNVVDFKRSLRQ